MVTYLALLQGYIPNYSPIIANGVIVWAPLLCLVNEQQEKHMRLI